MRALLLAAGYATRMRPLTADIAKPLLSVGGVPLLDYIVAKVLAVETIDHITLVTNHRFHEHFANWLDWRPPNRPMTLIDDGSTDNDSRLGAIGDIALALERESIDDDLLVLATDNLFQFSLADFVAYFRDKNADCVIVQHEPDAEARKRTGIVEVDDDWRVIGFEEKPAQPKTAWRCPPFYLYKRETLPLVREYLAGGNNPDAPGNFIAWLHQQRPVYGYNAPGDVLDIGSVDGYYAANRFATRDNLKSFLQ